MPIKIYDPLHIFKTLLMWIIMLFALGMIVYHMFQIVAAMNAGDRLEALMQLFIMLFWCAVLCYPVLRMVLPYFVENAVSWLLLPSRKITEPVELISPIQGLIRQEKYEEARQKLEEILAEHPNSMSANFLLATLCFDYLNQPQKGIATVERYFSAPRIALRAENVDILLRYCDLCDELGRRPEALALLERECRRAYAPPEKRILTQRRQALTG